MWRSGRTKTSIALSWIQMTHAILPVTSAILTLVGGKKGNAVRNIVISYINNKKFHIASNSSFQKEISKFNHGEEAQDWTP